MPSGSEAPLRSTLNDDVDLLETWVVSLNDTLWRLESTRDWRISLYQVSCPKLIVILVHKHLGLKDVVQAFLVNQTEVWFNSASICRTMKSKGLGAKQHKS